MERSLRNSGRPTEPASCEKSRSVTLDAAYEHERDDSHASVALPSHVAGSGYLDRLIETARDFAKASTAENTNKAYAADWKHFARWCRLKAIDPLPPSHEVIGLYLADLAAPTNGTPALSVSRCP